MNIYLFTIGIGVKDAPQRWTSICKIYANLARGLKKIGHRCIFLVNPNAFDAKALNEFDTYVGDHKDLDRIVVKYKPNFCFIWGGRNAADRVTIEIICKRESSPIFSELGWFPQKGTIYFDTQGTNSEISLAQPKKMTAVERLIFNTKRYFVSRHIYGCAVRRQSLLRPTKRIFVPLQDESDTNITQSSPFKRMDEMLAFLSSKYPTYEFEARVHPKSPLTAVNKYPNVKIQDPKVNLYKSLAEFDLIVGINSTVLAESVFLGYPTICFGDGITKKYNLGTWIDSECPPDFLTPHLNSDQAQTSLAHLFLIKQLQQRKLSSPRYLKKSYLADILAL